MKTTMANASTVNRKWYVVDASKYTLGRLASQVAAVLRGKHKPDYTPHVDCGDYVIVINAKDFKLTGNKMEQKTYFRHTGYIGGAKVTPIKEVLEKHPERVFEHAVKGMLPKGALGEKMYKKLFVYAGSEHEQQAQKPEEWNF